MTRRIPRDVALAAFVLVLAPILLLFDALALGATFFPWDPARFPPASAMLDDESLAIAQALPSNLDVTEVPGLVVPELDLARQELAAGRFPSWNPYARFGAPLFANGLAAMGNPLNVVFLLSLDPRTGLAWRTAIALAAAGLLAFALFRRLSVALPAACFGALVFQLGGTLAANAPFYMRLDPLVLLPGLVLAITALADARGRARKLPAAGLAACIALTLLAGFPPFAVADGFVLALVGLGMFVALARRDGRREALAFLGWSCGAGALGVLLAAFQLAPMFAFFPESNRELAPTTDAILGQGLDLPLALSGLLLPDAIGWPGEAPTYGSSSLVHLLWSRTNQHGSLQYPTNWGFTEYALHPGLLALVAALLGATVLRTPRQRLLAATLPIVFVLAVAPRAIAALYHLPVIASVQPMRFVAPCALCIAMLAGIGLETALAGTARKRIVFAALAALCIAVAAFGLRASAPLADHDAVIDAIWRRFQGADRPQFPREDVARLFPSAVLDASHARLTASLTRAGWIALAAASWFGAALVRAHLAPHALVARRALAALAIGGTALELLLLAAPLDHSRVLQRDPLDTPVHEFLRDRNAAHAGRGGIVIARAAPVAEDPLTLPPLLFPARIRDLNAYAFVDGRSYRPFLSLYGESQMIRRYWPKSFPDDDRLARPFFDLIGLRYVASEQPLAHAGVRVGPTALGPRSTPFFLYERASAMPRAFVVPALRALPDDDAIVAALIDPALDPRAAVLVDPGAAAALGEFDSAAGPPRAVRFDVDRPDRIELEVDGGAPGYLVLADAPLSGWTATVDGEPVAIHRGNLFMRVVPLGASASRVVFSYEAPGLAVGSLISALAACAWLALFVARRPR